MRKILPLYLSRVEQVVLDQIHAITATEMARFRLGLQLLGIEVPLQHMDESGALQAIPDERQRQIMVALWERIRQLYEDESRVLVEIDAIRSAAKGV